MSDDIWQEYRGLAREPAAPPERFEATDSSGTVRVTVGPDGLPESIGVEAGWRRSLGAESLGRAVSDAYGEAVQAWMRSAVPLAPTEGPASAGDVRPGDELTVADRLAPDGLRQPPSRSLYDMLAELTTVGDAITKRSDETGGAVSGTGSTAFGKLAITLTGTGELSCVADPYWVSEQDPQELTEALNRALAAARDDLAGASNLGTFVPKLDSLAAELRILVRGIRDLAGPGGQLHG